MPNKNGKLPDRGFESDRYDKATRDSDGPPDFSKVNPRPNPKILATIMFNISAGIYGT